MNIPDTIQGVKEALMKHAMDNAEKFGAIEASLKAGWRYLEKLKKHEAKEEKEKEMKMADTIVAPGSDNAALMDLLAGRGGDGIFGGNSLIGSLILGSLLRNNGNLFGGNNDNNIGSAATQVMFYKSLMKV